MRDLSLKSEITREIGLYLAHDKMSKITNAGCARKCCQEKEPEVG